MTDGFLAGDNFAVYDNGVLIKTTPPVPADSSNTCSDLPDACYHDSAHSHGSVRLAAGSHVITIDVVDSPFVSGQAFFRFDPAALITGSGNTAATPTNAFTIDVPYSGGGTVTYTGSTRSFSGTVTCTNIIGNAATIVSQSAGGAIINRTFVQDNGLSGDKLINTNVDTTKASAKTIAKYSTCIDPPVAELAARPALDGDAIQIDTSTGV